MRDSRRYHPALQPSRFDTLLSTWITGAMFGLCALAVVLLLLT